MNPRFLRYYSQELQHLREMGGEFAQDYPKIAGRLGLDGFDCTDPYVERLLEGFSFLAARVQMKLDAEFPRFTGHLAELVYPHFLAPTPSMAVVQLQPDLTNPALQKGFTVARGSAMRSVLGKDDNTACEYRSAHDLTLWPVELAEASFVTISGAQTGVTLPPAVKAGIRLRLRTSGAAFRDLPLDRLCLHLRGADALPVRIYEMLLGSIEGVLVMPGARPAGWHALLPKTALRPRGFGADDALLPAGGRSFAGYRLLQEYFAFPQRYQFVDLCGLRASLARCAGKEIEITILLNRADAQLEKTLDASHFALHCTPVVNLFERRADRISVSGEQFEYHVLVDRTRPLDYEVFQVAAVTGYGSGPGAEQAFRPFYTARDLGGRGGHDGGQAYFQIRREPRVLSQRQRRDGPRSSYVGSEAFISIVDAARAPYSSDLRQLGLTVWCTNRDLPLSMPLGVGKTDFLLEAGAPVTAVRCLTGPSQPHPSFAEGSAAWRLLNHLSLNYLSLLDTDPAQGAVALREMLALYCHPGDLHSQRQVEGVRSIASKAITRRMPSPGPITFGRGIEISVTFDDAAFEGTGAFLLGAVLAEFFAEYVSINSFTETVIKTLARGQIMRWPARGGTCAIL
ncbi:MULTISPECIES: type VI secretion system baseplate subunit TssF [unclassified Massilia]|uniref:type VI secretion system baseplate subunit TssF n=1 Tax=unclassified Massilia TaxID=2609279 RepID=UPI00177FA2AD|nr:MULTISPECIES: type VI secretion system baseplate subunit TssF [unclassified Massilia]MBD8528363.1 type VI secretion system baseplate subunit TssF [Massilia sp. CFBP 13647]MBD8672015.1 type VI secretion system baseplate subunit TssF [Massilia sp. CFBP 13721]